MNPNVFHCWLHTIHANEDALESRPGHTRGSHRWVGMMAPLTGELVQEKLRGGSQRKVAAQGGGNMGDGMKMEPNIKVFFRLMPLAVSCALLHQQHLCWQEAFPCTAFYSRSFSFCFQLCGLWGEQLTLAGFQCLSHEQLLCSFLNLSDIPGAEGSAGSPLVPRVGRTLLPSGLGWASCPKSCPAAWRTACLRAASHNAAKIPHLDSITLCSHYFRNRNCPYQLFRVTPKGKCMLCYMLLLSASGTSNLFSCQHWFIKQHTEV